MVRRSRTPQGVRGLKPAMSYIVMIVFCRTPQGVRGLKLEAYLMDRIPATVALRKECVD